MARRLSDNDIMAIRACYKTLGTYAAVSRKLGFSASTVKKYVQLSESQEINKQDETTLLIKSNEKFPNFEKPKPIEEIKCPSTQEGWSNWCSLSDEEVLEVLSFTKNLIV